jgi:N-sulfoglucosamine sulfohydrolase
VTFNRFGSFPSSIPYPMKISPSILLGLALLALPLAGAKRNILFIITDDLSPTLGCYGDPVAVSPAVDRLARDGTLFHRAYATTASCSASRSVVMSGLHNHRNGQYGHTHKWHKFESFREVLSLSLPRALARAGYRTGQAGKYHVAPEEVYRYQHYIEGPSRDPVRLAENCREFLSSSSDQPFFLYFGIYDPHRGGGFDKSAAGTWKPDMFGNRPDRRSHEMVDEVFFDPATVPIPPFLPDTAYSRRELANYYQSAARADQGVARLVSILQENGLYDDTLIVFTSDHGMAFAGAKTTVYEGGLRVPFVVRNPYAENRGVESHALISHVDITPSLLDFANYLDRESNLPRTVPDASAYWEARGMGEIDDNLGYIPLTSYHGKSWLRILGDPDATHHEYIFGSHTFHEIQMYYPMRSLFDGEYKLIWNIAHHQPYPFASDLWASATWQAQLAKGPTAPYGLMTVNSYLNRPAFELYHLAETGVEGENLATDPRHAGRLATMQEKLKEYQQATDDPWIMKWRYE